MGSTKAVFQVLTQHHLAGIGMHVTGQSDRAGMHIGLGQYMMNHGLLESRGNQVRVKLFQPVFGTEINYFPSAMLCLLALFSQVTGVAQDIYLPCYLT